MTTSQDAPAEIEQLLAAPDIADALASDQFKKFLDHVPVGVVVSEIKGEHELIVYANHEAQEVTGLPAEALIGEGWRVFDDIWSGDDALGLGAAILESGPVVKRFAGLDSPAKTGRAIEAQAAVVTNDDDVATYRLVALVDVSSSERADRDALEAQLKEKDLLLQEIQHRVRNNLQMITALIRMEARRAGDQMGGGSYERLAGRIEALGLLYRHLEASGGVSEVELGSFLSQIAGAVMLSHAMDGVRLDLQVEALTTSIDVAMPVGLLVNELITNALKYAFDGREAGVVAVRCLKDGGDRCVVSVGDDGVGFADGVEWPRPGKLGALIVRSIEENTRAKVETSSRPGEGVKTQIRFSLRPPARR